MPEFPTVIHHFNPTDTLRPLSRSDKFDELPRHVPAHKPDTNGGV
jgi:hypothetical protein